MFCVLEDTVELKKLGTFSLHESVLGDVTLLGASPRTDAPQREGRAESPVDSNFTCRIFLAPPPPFLQDLRATLKFLTVIGISKKKGNFVST
jgi:hypothetical protein